MEAKDTVMPHKQRVECSHNPVLELREKDMCEAQAEISFTAGRDEEYKKWIKACMKAGMLISKPEQIVNLYKAGIREVVEWIKENIAIETTDQGVLISGYIAGEKWQAKLKEWGIE